MSVFNALYADQYDALYTDKNYVAECDLVEAACRRNGVHPKSILDIGCGTGTHVIEFARRGYDCTGVDLSPAMLTIANTKAAELNVQHSPQWLNADAREFEAGRTFDVAVMMFAVISYLTRNEDVIQALRNIRRHLSVGGLFICDFWYGPAVLSVKPNERVRVLDTQNGKTIRAASTTLDTYRHTADVTFKLWSTQGDTYLGETSETHTMRYFFPQEFALLLQQAGFELISLSQFPELDVELSNEAWNAFAVARCV